MEGKQRTARSAPRTAFRFIAATAFAVLLTACGAGAPGGGTSSAATQTGSSKGSAAAPAAQAVTSTSLKGWTVVAGSGGTGPVIDNTTGDPKPPSLEIPGDKSYLWIDPKKAIKSFSFDANTQGLFDLFFGANASGQGLMFRIDTRGGSNYSGFAETEDWNDWDCPQSGSTDIPSGTWIHVTIAVGAKDVTATASWSGNKETFDFNGTSDGCNTMSDGTTLDSTLSAYKPVGTAFGFQGDGLGATSESWIANFQYQ